MKWLLLLAGMLIPLTVMAQTDAAAPSACAKCHVEGLTQPTTYMAHALESVEKCSVLQAHPLITATIGKYSYRIETKGDKSVYSVTDGSDTVSMDIAWAMGASSAMGQTYILQKDGQLFESRVSWFRQRDGLDVTMGSQDHPPSSLAEAAGRLMHTDDKLRCFGCHSTHAAEGHQLTLEKLIPGVQCAHCHQGVQAHLDAALAGSHDLAPPPDLHKLIARSAEQTSNFCGQCHRTWAEIAMQPSMGIGNIRFQPYRLTGSKCFDPDDPRIGCLACHNPHHDFGPKQVNFDSKCLACHAGGKPDGVKKVAAKPGAKACPVATENCVSCHMPKLDLPGAHYQFTDHRIRIVKPGAPYPG
jgi:hypothetical protein